ncbi:type VII secretion target [Micromonospora sp. WMMD980]|uniref:type VII secretion target n=1 Tax=Micromonospora sp. WMMD980 TaxID=3016088 RepID=UPI0024178F39|nr:type VII secretion target [Micromonospora sp. WMMD980]MDG4800989.1 type VII secretion target [Micromonospora sp. WMMD980]
MPGGEVLQVDPDDLTVHAAHLDRCADSIDTARQAGQDVRLGHDAYGQLRQIVPLLLDGLQRTLVDGVATAATAVRDTAGKVRTSAERYHASDTHAAHLLDQVRNRR